MKIALISEHASPLAAPGGVDCGGQNVYVAHVAKQLAGNGHHVDIFTRRDSLSLSSVTNLGPRVRVIHIPAGPPHFIAKESLLPHMPEFIDRAGQWWNRRTGDRNHAPYDVIHASFFMSGLAALHLRQRHGTPFVITFHALGKVRRLHQGKADGFPTERIAIEQNLMASADRVIAECPQDRQDMIDLYDADPTRIDLVPCGFDPDELSPGPRHLRAELGLSDDDFVVLHLGRLVPRKGIDNVIRGIAELKRRHGIHAILLIVGGETDTPDAALNPEMARLSAIAADEGVAKQVRFTGRQPRHLLRHFYCAADVFVSTPWYETFGIAPLEAMACGCPVIGAAVGGLQHSIADGATGFLIPPNDPVVLAEKLATLHQDKTLCEAFGQAGMKRVRANFTWRRVAAALTKVYQKTAEPVVQLKREQRVTL
ncbi:MAG TPA: glycosyltransferase family 1 protein [Rhodocyclaceae bacterium]|nr:glycosyltransferase family 1 protein [Rhodocyclaceae bacterium]